MEPRDIILIGAPVDSGKRRRGCLMGPDAYRVAGLGEALASLGHRVSDRGNLLPDPADVPVNPRLWSLAETVGWTVSLARPAEEAAGQGMPIFLGGDHALSMGSVAGLAAHASRLGKPPFLPSPHAHRHPP